MNEEEPVVLLHDHIHEMKLPNLQLSSPPYFHFIPTAWGRTAALQ